MRVVVRRRDPEEDDRQTEDAREAGADRDRATLADVDRRLAERRLERPRRGERRGMIHRRQARVTATEGPDARPDARRRDLLDVRAEGLEDPVGILVCDEAAADLGVRMCRDDGLTPLAHEAAPDAVDVERRPDRAPLERRVAGFADERRQAETLEIRVLV